MTNLSYNFDHGGCLARAWRPMHHGQFALLQTKLYRVALAGVEVRVAPDQAALVVQQGRGERLVGWARLRHREHHVHQL